MNNCKNPFPDTPWHIGFAKMNESDTRRHRAHCLFYNYDNKECMTAASPCYGSKCGGSSHCMSYKEEIKIDDMFAFIANTAMVTDDDKIADMLGIEKCELEKYEQVTKETKDKQQKLVTFVWSFLESKFEEERIFEVIANRISSQSQGHDILDYNQRKELEKYKTNGKISMEFSEKTMGRKLYRNTVFIYILVMKKILVSRKRDYSKYLKNFYAIFGYIVSDRKYELMDSEYTKSKFEPYIKVISNDSSFLAVKAYCFEKCFEIFCNKFFESEIEVGPTRREIKELANARFA